MKTEIIIRAPRPQEIIGENSRRINELTALVQKRCVLRGREADRVDLASTRTTSFCTPSVSWSAVCAPRRRPRP